MWLTLTAAEAAVRLMAALCTWPCSRTRVCWSHAWGHHCVIIFSGEKVKLFLWLGSQRANKMVSVLCLMTHLDAFLFFCELTHLVVGFFLSSAVLPLCDSVSRQFLHCLNFVLSLLPFKDSLLVFDPSFIHENCNPGFNLSAACCLLFNILLIKAIRLGLLHLFICIQFQSCFQSLGTLSCELSTTQLACKVSSKADDWLFRVCIIQTQSYRILQYPGFCKCHVCSL